MLISGTNRTDLSVRSSVVVCVRNLLLEGVLASLVVFTRE